MASVTQLGYLGIGVSDLARWEHFAANVLGLEVNGADADGSTFLRMDEYHHRFILQPGSWATHSALAWSIGRMSLGKPGPGGASGRPDIIAPVTSEMRRLFV